MGNQCGGAYTGEDTEGVVRNEFLVSLEKDDGEVLGVDLDTMDSYSARVTEVFNDGVVATWNTWSSRAKQIRAGDHIVEVNGSGAGSGAGALLQQLKKSDKLEITMWRPLEFSIQVSRDGGLGIDHYQAANARSLMVRNIIGDGAIAKWNKEHPGRAVWIYDRIVQVNGQRGTWETLQDRASQATDLRLVVSACSPLRRKKREGVQRMCTPPPAAQGTEAEGGVAIEDIPKDSAEETPKDATEEPAKAPEDEPKKAPSVTVLKEEKKEEEEEENPEMEQNPELTGAAAPPAAEAKPPAAAGPTTLQVQVPHGVTPGQLLQVQAPDGRVLKIAVPPGVQPGQTLQVQV